MKNTKHNLKDFFEALQKDLNFITLKDRLKNNGGIITNLNINLKDDNKISVYSAEMFYLLTSDNYANESFISAYNKGFEAGKVFIKKKTKKALKGFYSSCPEKYIEELRNSYFIEAPNEPTGYKWLATSYPTDFNIEQIEKIGFSAGVINAIDLMAKEEPLLFSGFYEENNIIETEEKLTIKQIALKLVYENKNVTKENADEIIKQYRWTSGQSLLLKFNFYYKRINRIGRNNDTKKVLENKIELIESVIELLEENFKQKAIDECKTLKNYLTDY